MTQIELFNKFKEEHNGVNMSTSTFVQPKPWYVKPTIVCETCCHYHVDFELYYDTFIEFGKTFLENSPPPSTIHDIYAKFYVKEKVMNYFTKKMCW